MVTRLSREQILKDYIQMLIHALKLVVCKHEAGDIEDAIEVSRGIIERHERDGKP